MEIVKNVKRTYIVTLKSGAIRAVKATKYMDAKLAAMKKFNVKITDIASVL